MLQMLSWPVDTPTQLEVGVLFSQFLLWYKHLLEKEELCFGSWPCRVLNQARPHYAKMEPMIIHY